MNTWHKKQQTLNPEPHVLGFRIHLGGGGGGEVSSKNSMPSLSRKFMFC